MPRPPGPQRLTLPQQAGLLRVRYPASRVELTHHRLVWVGTLQPADWSDTYELLVDHQVRKTPIVYVVSPQLQAPDGMEALEHVFGHNLLCLHLDDEWTAADHLAETIVPWTCEWLVFYELWVATGGEWHGGGVHPEPGQSSRGRFDRRHRGPSKKKRLETALRRAYGSNADLNALMFNTMPPTA